MNAHYHHKQEGGKFVFTIFSSENNGRPMVLVLKDVRDSNLQRSILQTNGYRELP